jgi:hypothetical protein
MATFAVETFPNSQCVEVISKMLTIIACSMHNRIDMDIFKQTRKKMTEIMLIFFMQENARERRKVLFT